MKQSIGLNKLFILLLFVLSLTLNNCGHRIYYNLNSTSVVSVSNQIPLNLHVAIFSDDRPPQEKMKNEREKLGCTDCNDYTYDKEFEGEFVQDFSNMVVKHLTYSNIFSNVTLTEYLSNEIEPDVLPSLKRQGVDLIMTGKIKNFYGYYDRNQGSEIGLGLLFGLGFSIPIAFATLEEETHRIGNMEYKEVKTNQAAIYLASAAGVATGFYLESLSKRRIAKQCKLLITLYDTATSEIILEKIYDISSDSKGSLPGITPENSKFNVALKALNQTINDLIIDIDNLGLYETKQDSI